MGNCSCYRRRKKASTDQVANNPRKSEIFKAIITYTCVGSHTPKQFIIEESDYNIAFAKTIDFMEEAKKAKAQRRITVEKFDIFNGKKELLYSSYYQLENINNNNLYG